MLSQRLIVVSNIDIKNAIFLLLLNFDVFDLLKIRDIIINLIGP